MSMIERQKQICREAEAACKRLGAHGMLMLVFFDEQLVLEGWHNLPIDPWTIYKQMAEARKFVDDTAKKLDS